jgi:hypothetical protein
MDPVARAEALIRLLLAREPGAEELEQFQKPGFDCDAFLIKLLCTDEASARFGDIAQFLIDQLKSEIARDALPHKLAHDLALAQEELAGLQGRLDRLNGQMLDLLKQENRIVGLFDAIRALQAEFNAARGRLNGIETQIFATMETANAE